MSKQFGVAIIGCGQFGSKRANAITANSSLRLIGVYDPNNARATTLAETYHVQQFLNIKALLSHPLVDGVVISSPNYLHAEQSILALLQHKHVLCEKPAGICRNDFDMLTATINRVSQSNWQYGFNHRFFEPVIQLKQWLDQDIVGAIDSIELSIASGRNKDSSQWFTNSQLSGGGTLIDNGHHCIDLLLWLLPEQWQVTAALIEPTSSQTVEQYAHLMLATQKIEAVITSRWQSAENYLSIIVRGKKGKITIGDETALLTTHTDTSSINIPLKPGSAICTEVEYWRKHSVHNPAKYSKENLQAASAIYTIIADAYSRAQL